MSPRLPVDFSDAEEFGELPLDHNPFYCEVTDISEVEESEKGNLYVSAEFTVIDGEFEGRKLWRNLPITGRGAGFWLDFARKAMHNMDLTRDEIADIPAEDFLGQDVEVIVMHEEYQGETRNRIKTLLIPE